MGDPPAQLPPPGRRQLIGNRWALAGAILYLLEWVAIIGIPGGVQIPTTPGTSSAAILREYSQAWVPGLALSAGWFGLVLPGRILLIAGIRQALRRSGEDNALADLAVGAMAVSVAIEIANYAVAAGVGLAAASGADQSAVVTGHTIANLLNFSIFSPLGLSILAISLVMLLSRLFPWWLCVLGVIAGAALCVAGVIGAAGFQVGGPLFQVGTALNFAVLGFWVWMLVTGVLLFRAAGRQPRISSPA